VTLPPTCPAALQSHLAKLWPHVADKLAERAEAFRTAAWQQAARRGLTGLDSASRYLNLCFAFGPAFEERAENEWALALLADGRLGEGLRLHQLVLRALRELRRRGLDEQALQRADQSLLAWLDRERQAADADAPPLARVACDLEALDLRLLDTDWRHEYRVIGGTWQRLPGPPPATALRIDAQQPAPAALTVLTHAAGEGPAALLQSRQILHGGCGARHPAIRWLDTSGLMRWHGHEAKARSWPVYAMAQPEPSNGLGLALVEETAAAVHLLEAGNCGLRDEGLALGPQALRVHAYPAHQWLFALQRGAGSELQWPPADAPAPTPAPTRLRIERDGAARNAAPWQHGFDTELPKALHGGLSRLFEAWQQTAQNARQQATPALLVGQAAVSWGWREGPAGLADAPLMRLLGELDLGCGLALALEGDIELGASRTHVRLSAEGDSRATWSLLRERPQPGLMDSLLPVTLKLRLPFTLSFDPIATEDATVCAEAGPCSGALLGEAGLRPRLSGGSGWQWFVRLALEPVTAPFTVHDPLLGQTRRTLALLPAMPLLDWSLG
jgi:hypothetical protein